VRVVFDRIVIEDSLQSIEEFVFYLISLQSTCFYVSNRCNSQSNEIAAGGI
jgi:hypothetical protein